MQNKTTELFKNPDSSYKGKPFWAWNELLKEDELRRQIDIFNEMGFGGFFMHSRVGLRTEYLGREWFSLTDACIDQADKNDMEAWLYDEDRWPSGAAGGIVTKDPKYRIRELLMIKQAKAGELKKDDFQKGSYVFSLDFEGDRLKSYSAISSLKEAQKLDSDAKTAVYRCIPYETHPNFNDATYLDTLNPEAVEKFIQVTHEQYRKRNSEQFGKTIPGIFTDEPNFGRIFRKNWLTGGDLELPWTGTLPKFFENMFKYDLTEHLPALYFKTADDSFLKIRHHYCRCVNAMFVKAFAELIGKWCEDNNLLFTGHILDEAPLQAAMASTGPAMPFYKHMQAPGIDILTQYRIEFFSAKQASSVARQMGRKWVLSELYGCTGWETTFETYKHSGDWQAATGITLRCPHLSLYSMAGEAKRDYPASIHFHSPWYQEYSQLEDYYSRVHVAMTQGQAVCDMLVINPIESYSMMIGPGWYDSEPVLEMENKYENLFKWLLSSPVDFDFADEQLLNELAVGVAADEQGPYIHVGQCRYRTILVPPMITIRQTTLRILEMFEDINGKVVYLKDLPGYVDGVKSDKAVELADDKAIEFSEENIKSLMRDNFAIVSINDEDGKPTESVIHQLRRDDAGYYLFVVNNDREKSYANLDFAVKGDFADAKQVQLWDPFTTERTKLAAEIAKDSVRFKIDLPKSGSALLFIANEAEQLTETLLTEPTGSSIDLPDEPVSYTLHDHNVLVLDRADLVCQAKGKDTLTADNIEILRADRKLRDHMGLPYRGGDMVQPWARKEKLTCPDNTTTLTYTFGVEQIPQEHILLGIEKPQYWQIELNGSSIDPASQNGWWTDPAIKTIPIDPKLLKTGKNTLKLTGSFEHDLDLEIMFLLGGFGVKTDGMSNTMTTMPAKLTAGSWLEQGLPFYGHNVTYHYELELAEKPQDRCVLELAEKGHTAMAVSVNGGPLQLLPWPPYQADISDKLNAGKNSLDIKVIASRRNAFGPLHLAERVPIAFGPFSFTDQHAPFQEEYQLIDYGILERPVIKLHKSRQR